VAIRQLHHQRRQQALQPQLQAIRDRYRDDLAAQRRAFAELGGTNPLPGCLPMLLQLPMFLALLQVLRHLANSASLAAAVQSGQPVASANRLTLYGFSQHQTISAARAQFLGAPLAASLHRGANYVETVLHGSYTATQTLVLLVVTVSAVASYLAQRRLQAAGPPPADGPAATISRLLPALIPVSVIISGLFFPLGLLWYWCVSNVWTLAQQLYLNRFHPHPERVARQSV
jgi:YidC/Oxa1 family membrane protein insertase